MPPPDADQAWAQNTSPPPLSLNSFVFLRPQYHNGSLSASERLNERRIRMALMAHGDGPDSLVKLSPQYLHDLLRGSQQLIDGCGEFDPSRTIRYEKHEEIESVYELIRFREAYMDKLIAYCQQKIHPRTELVETGPTLVDFNKK